MYLKINNKKINIQEYTTFKERIKTLRFTWEPLTDAIKLPRKKFASTDFFLQRVDICFTDKDETIIALYENVATERRFFKRKAYNVYFLPLNTVKDLKKGEKLPIKK